jgi:hypothetical protein
MIDVSSARFTFTGLPRRASRPAVLRLVCSGGGNLGRFSVLPTLASAPGISNMAQ